MLAIQFQWQKWQDKYSFHRYLSKGQGRKFYIMGSPQYSNLGDSAIDLAQRQFLKTIGASDGTIKEITKEEYQKYRNLICRSVTKKDVITCIGGGNMGDEWLAEEKFRRDILEAFPDHIVTVFPQTLYYTPTEKGLQESRKAEPFYNRENCILVAREKTSYTKMQQSYPEARIYLTPDIVLSLTAQDFGVTPQKRNGALLVLRRDVESSLTENERKALLDAVEALGLPVIETDMYAEQRVTKENRKELVQKKMQQFAASRLVVTDRLHGMVFAAITQTPCVVLGNYNHKVEGTYAWLKELPYIRFAHTIDQAKQLMPYLFNMNQQLCKYDATTLQAAFSTFRKDFEELTTS